MQLLPLRDVQEKKKISELEVEGISSIPESMITALQTSEAQIYVTCGLSFVIDGPQQPIQLTNQSGGILDGSIKWSQTQRHLFTSEQLKSIQEHVENSGSLQIEVARYIKQNQPSSSQATVIDTCFDFYHACQIAQFQSRDLKPGQKEFVFEVCLDQSYKMFERQNKGFSILQVPKIEPKSKLPVFEQPPLVAKDELAYSMWQKASSVLRLKIKFEEPLIAEWRLPPQPSLSLQDLMTNKILTQQDYKDDPEFLFKTFIQNTVYELAQLYQDKQDCMQNSKQDISQEKFTKDLIFELNRNGKFAQILEQMKGLVANQIQQRYTKQDQQEGEYVIQTQLYADLQQHISEVLDSIYQRKVTMQERNLVFTQEYDYVLAKQYEQLENYTMAQQLYVRQIQYTKNKEAWQKLGLFYLRTSSITQADECFKQALELDPGYVEALLVIACSKTQQAILTDILYLNEAEVYVSTLRNIDPLSYKAWALQHLIHKTNTIKYNKDIVRNSLFKLKDIVEDLNRSSQNAMLNPFFEIAKDTLEFHLFDVHNRAMQIATSYDFKNEQPPAQEIFLINQTLKYRQGAFSEIIKNMSGSNVNKDMLENEDYKLLIGITCFKALQNFRNFMMWYQYGKVLIKLQKYYEAELAFSEANILDNYNTTVWGYLALCALKQEQQSYFNQALYYACKTGYLDKQVVFQLTQCMLDTGKQEQVKSFINNVRHGLDEQDMNQVQSLLQENQSQIQSQLSQLVM